MKAPETLKELQAVCLCCIINIYAVVNNNSSVSNLLLDNLPHTRIILAVVKQ